ncbi:hypothetical protein B0H17DRAFT_920854 [Mycena rosella]|uniref:Uncharacterized protein n=1 Tax=Mycena rosella TaxID=1033263 RepID=A0AAD7GTF0_MYCRO|nr:hypothetical protein B0H17DRAFT_920854 [Mycena rosella]
MYHVWRDMCKTKTAVTCLTEPRFNDKQKEDFNRLFRCTLRLEFSQNPNTADAMGVAVLLNKNLVKTTGIITREVVPGRAMLVEMRNVSNSPLSILIVYTPNTSGENAMFWRTIQQWFVDNN